MNINECSPNEGTGSVCLTGEHIIVIDWRKKARKGLSERRVGETVQRVKQTRHTYNAADSRGTEKHHQSIEKL